MCILLDNQRWLKVELLQSMLCTAILRLIWQGSTMMYISLCTCSLWQLGIHISTVQQQKLLKQQHQHWSITTTTNECHETHCFNLSIKARQCVHRSATICGWHVLYCTVLYWTVLSGVTKEAEACMTIHGQCWGQFKSAHCAKSLVYARCVCIYWWCAAAVSRPDSTCESIWRAWGCMFIVCSPAVSFF